MVRTVTRGALLAAAALAATPSLAQYRQILSPTVTRSGITAANNDLFGISVGNDVYHAAARTGTPRDFGIFLNGTTPAVADRASFLNDGLAVPSDRILPGVSTDYSLATGIVIFEQQADRVVTVSLNGDAAELVSNSAIDAFIGGTGPSISDGGLLADGTVVFEEFDTDSLLGFDGTNVVSVISNTVLEAGQGGDDDIDSGVAGSSFNDLYWGNNATDAIMTFDGTSVSVAIPAATVAGLVGGPATYSGDFFAAPDGLIYLRAGSSGDNAVLSFDPADPNPAGTLTTVLSNADLLAGPFGDDNISNFSWFGGELAFSAFSGGYYGFVPEPTTGVLVAMAGLFAAARRR
ncbi:MAG: PEP-CTERM sorting domain-containing protein [Planctomycetota bacterium]